MNDSLGNLLALVVEGKLTRAQAKSAAAGMWLNGAIPVADLPAFAAEVQKVWEEAETARYVENVVKRTWPEIEQILCSTSAPDAVKAGIRAHPEARYKRTAWKMLHFGAVPMSPQSMVYSQYKPKGFDLISIDELKRRWNLQWPEIATWLKTVDPATCDKGVTVGPFRLSIGDLDPVESKLFSRELESIGAKLYGFQYAALHELGGKGGPAKIPVRKLKASRSGTQAKTSAARRKRSKATRKARAVSRSRR